MIISIEGPRGPRNFNISDIDIEDTDILVRSKPGLTPVEIAMHLSRTPTLINRILGWTERGLKLVEECLVRISDVAARPAWFNELSPEHQGRIGRKPRGEPLDAPVLPCKTDDETQHGLDAVFGIVVKRLSFSRDDKTMDRVMSAVYLNSFAEKIEAERSKSQSLAVEKQEVLAERDDWKKKYEALVRSTDKIALPATTPATKRQAGFRSRLAPPKATAKQHGIKAKKFKRA